MFLWFFNGAIYLLIYIESACLQAVAMIKNGDRNKSKYAFMIREINRSMGGRDSHIITHIRHNCNSARHFMANLGRLQC